MLLLSFTLFSLVILGSLLKNSICLFNFWVKKLTTDFCRFFGKKNTDYDFSVTNMNKIETQLSKLREQQASLVKCFHFFRFF